MDMLEDEDLIDEVKQCENIWNKADPSYGKIKPVEKSWMEISNRLKCDVEECKSRWIVIRNRYARECRTIRVKACIGGAEHEITWPHYNRLSFLNGMIKPRRLRSRNLPRSVKYGEKKQTNFPIKSEEDDIQVVREEEIVFDGSLSPFLENENTNTTETCRMSTSTNQSKRKNNDNLSNLLVQTVNACSNMKDFLTSSQLHSNIPEGISQEDWHCALSIGISLESDEEPEEEDGSKIKITWYSRRGR